MSILDDGADVNEIGYHKWPLLTEAADHGHAALVAKLLDRGAQLDAHDVRDGKTALHWAAMTGKEEVVAVLLERGAEADARDIHGQYTALHLAASHSKIQSARKVIKQLLDFGADINARSKWGTTALISAAFGGKTETIDFLLQHGAEIDAQATNGKTALITVARVGFRAEATAKFLLERGANPEIRDNDGKTALMWAASQAETGVIKALLDCEVDPFARDNAGCTALMHAAGPAPDPGFIHMIESLKDEDRKPKHAATLQNLWLTRAKSVRLLMDSLPTTEERTKSISEALDLANSTHGNPAVLDVLNGAAM